MLGDVVVIEFREPADKQRHAIGRVDADAKCFRCPRRRDICGDLKHSPRRALEQSREIGRLHRDPRIGGVIDELQPLRRFVLGVHKKLYASLLRESSVQSTWPKERLLGSVLGRAEAGIPRLEGLFQAVELDARN